MRAETQIIIVQTTSNFVVGLFLEDVHITTNSSNERRTRMAAVI